MRENLRETSTMNEKEMFYLRKLHFLVECFWNLDVYKPLLKAVRRYGVSVVEILDRLLNLAKNPDLSLGQTGKKIKHQETKKANQWPRLKKSF